MARFTTIIDCNAALGGYEFRVTSNGAIANIQSRHANNTTWRTEATMPLPVFEARHAERDNKLGPDYINAIAREFNEEAL